MKLFLYALLLLLSACTTTKPSVDIDATEIRCAGIAQDVEPLHINQSDSIDTQCVRLREHAEVVLSRYQQLLKCFRGGK
jgi:predicted component of type VI protein secretion system